MYCCMFFNYCNLSFVYYTDAAAKLILIEIHRMKWFKKQSTGNTTKHQREFKQSCWDKIYWQKDSCQMWEKNTIYGNDNLTPLFGVSIWLLWLQASFCLSFVHSVVLPTLTTTIWFFQVDFEVHKRYRFCALKGMKINPVSSVCLTSKVYVCG